MKSQRILAMLATVATAGLVAGPAPAAGAAGPGLAGEALGPAIMMGVATAAATQSIAQQDLDRAALRKRLRWLIDNRVSDPMARETGNHDVQHVRIVFDVDASGHSTNVRIGKRSRYSPGDQHVAYEVARFDRLPGGERRRVCVVFQYGHPYVMDYGSFERTMRDEQTSAAADLLAGRDGPQYDSRGRVIA